ncbi:MAG TPA: hypothetical protein VF278_21690, partial [Pirellulales bacterium]
GDSLLEVAITSAGQSSEAFIWNTTSYETIKTIRLTPFYDTGDFRVAPEGAGMASFGWYAGTLRIINPAGNEPAAFDRPALMSSRASFVAAWSPSGDMLAAVGDDGQICLWDLASARRRGLIPYHRWPDSLTWRADEPLLDAWLRMGGALRKAVIDGDAGNVRGYEIFDGVLAGADFLSSCGPACAVAHADRVKIFAGDPPRLLRELETASKFAPAFSRDGRRLATIADKTTIWDVANGKPLASFDAAAPVEWSPDGRRLAYTFAGGERFEVRDAESGELLTELRLNDLETSAARGAMVAAGARLAWSPDGSRIAGFGRVWNASSGEIVSGLQRFGRQANTGQPAWSPDGAYLAYRAHDGAVCIANAITGQVIDELLSFTRGRALAVSPSGHYRASPRFDAELVYVIETDAGQETSSPQEFADKYGWRNEPSLVGMGEGSGSYTQRVPGVQGSGGEEAPNNATPPHPNPLPEGEGTNHPKSLSPLALVQQPAALPGVESWSLESRTPRLHDPGLLYQHAALHPDGSILAAGGMDGNVRIYDLFGGKTPRLTRFLLGHTSPIAAIEWSPDGKWLATAERGRPSVRVWNPTTGKCLAEGLASFNTIFFLHWSPNGRTIAVCGDGGASLLDAQTAELLLPVDLPSGVFQIGWSTDATRVALQVNASVAILDAITGETLRSLVAPGDVMTGAVAWSPDGKSIACTSPRDVYVWSDADGALARQFTVPDLPQNGRSITWFDEGAKLRVSTNAR